MEMEVFQSWLYNINVLLGAILQAVGDAGQGCHDPRVVCDLSILLGHVEVAPVESESKKKHHQSWKYLSLILILPHEDTLRGDGDEVEGQLVQLHCFGSSENIRIC